MLATPSQGIETEPSTTDPAANGAPTRGPEQRQKGDPVIQLETHTIDSAPEESKQALRALEKGLGFVPNLAATMAESPALVSGFVDLRVTLGNTELTGVEREIVALATAIEYDCSYCMAAHSTFALMQDADGDAVRATRSGEAPDDPRLGALYRFARAMVAAKGRVSEEETDALLQAGYSRRAVLDVVAQIGHTTLASLAYALSKAQVDDVFAAQAWTRTEVGAARA
jgi:uncharacterized peroxidase-related enzyme